MMEIANDYLYMGCALVFFVELLHFYSPWNSLTLWEPVYDIFILRFRPKKQQFLVALPTTP